MTIYFAGSICGGRDDQNIYAAIIEQLRRYGKVVTEQVGDADVNLGGENAPDRDLHDRKKLSAMIAGCRAVMVHEYSRVG